MAAPRKLDDEQRAKLEELLKEGQLTYAQLGQRFGVTGVTIYNHAKRLGLTGKRKRDALGDSSMETLS